MTSTNVNDSLLGASQTSGLITNFSSISSHRIQIDGVEYGVQNGNYDWSLANPDSHTLRFEVHSGDQWKYDDDWKERSEVSSDSLIPYGETVSISYQFMVEEGSANKATGALGTGNWLTLGQFHSADGASSSTFAVELIGEKLAIRAAYKLPGEDYTSWYAFKDTADIVRGQYYDIKIDVKFANDDSGFLNVWRDGVQIVDYDGPMGYGDGVYWKYGIYRHEQSETIAVNYRDMSVGQGGNGEGVLIVGTKAGDEISAATSPAGQPTVTDKGDTIVGSGGGDLAVGGAGNDKVLGSKGNDVLKGGGGNDLIRGGAGNDKLFAVSGTNKMMGDQGKDLLVSGTGDDVLVGGKSKDAFVFTSDFGNDRIVGFKPGDDIIRFGKDIFADYAALKAEMSATKAGVLIDTDHGSVLIDHLKLGKVDQHDFMFV